MHNIYYNSIYEPFTMTTVVYAAPERRVKISMTDKPSNKANILKQIQNRIIASTKPRVGFLFKCIN